MDILGFGSRTKKQRRRETAKRNVQKGKAAEDLAKMSYQLRGYEVERTGKGSDFRVRKRSLLTGRVVESKLLEVKSGKSKLSKLQRKTKKKTSKYTVKRVEPFLY